MNNPIMALAQMAMNRISSDPSFQKNPPGRHATTSEMGRNWDKYLDARRHYNATKSDADRMEMSTSAKMHIGETIATLRDMWHDADPDLREKMKKDFSALLQEMN